MADNEGSYRGVSYSISHDGTLRVENEPILWRQDERGFYAVHHAPYVPQPDLAALARAVIDNIRHGGEAG